MRRGDHGEKPSKRSADNVAPASGVLIVRHATSRDLARVLEFYQTHSHAANHPRPQDVIHGAINDDRKLFVVERAEGAAELVAATAVFSHLAGKFRELGATRVVETGFGLQRLLASVRIVHEILMEPEFEELYCTVIPGNSASIHNIEKSLFVQWDDPDSELVREKARLAELAERSADVLYFRLPSEAFSFHAQKLLEYESKPRLRRKRSATGGHAQNATRSAEMGLVLKLESLMYYRPVVVDLARPMSTDEHQHD